MSYYMNANEIAGSCRLVIYVIAGYLTYMMNTFSQQNSTINYGRALA